MGAYVRYAHFALAFYFLITMPQVSASEDVSKNTRASDIAREVQVGRTQTRAVRPHWISGSNKFWFRTNNAPDDSTYVYIDPSEGLRQPAFDHNGVARALSQQGIDASAGKLPFTGIEVNEDCTIVRFCAGEKHWEWTEEGGLVPFDGEIHETSTTKMKALAEERPSTGSSRKTAIRFVNRTKELVQLYWIDWSGEAKHYRDVEPGFTAIQSTFEGHVWRVTRAKDHQPIGSFVAGPEQQSAIIKGGLFASKIITAQPESLSKRQSNGTHDASGVFFRDYNVWFRDAEGQENRMSTTGTEESPFTNWTYPSPDKKFVVVWQTTPSQDHIVYTVESSPYDQVQPRLRQYQYLKPGDKVSISRPRMFDLTKKQEVPTDDALFGNPYRIDEMNDGWNTESTEYRFIYNQRGHQVLRVVGMSTKGDVRAVIEDTSETFIDYAHKLYFREITSSNSSEMIWASERDGWNHLYLYDLKSGKVKNQITKGEWVVRSVDYVDEAKRQLWVKVFGAVSGQDPYYAHLARVNFDGSDFKILTEGDGSHSWYFSEDRSTFTDSWSRMDKASTTVTRDAETGTNIANVSEGNLDWVLWPVPERFTAMGRDSSTPIYGLIFRPYKMDNSTKYPVIEKIYAGPQDFYVPKEYKQHDEAHRLANQGFVVVLIDGMGTNWRSKAFHDICHKNLKDAGFPDRIAWMKAAASTRLWMDLDRVGVYGGSAGGQNAMGALLFHNDFYSVAAADCGCHDNRMDKLWWNEAWMGYPVDQSYEDSSNVVNAGKLSGSLLLSVGELDTNVDPASTMQVVNALNNANKDYDLVFIPGGGHGVGASDTYALRRTHEFLYRKLKGTEPPRK